MTISIENVGRLVVGAEVVRLEVSQEICPEES